MGAIKIVEEDIAFLNYRYKKFFNNSKNSLIY